MLSSARRLRPRTLYLLLLLLLPVVGGLALASGPQWIAPTEILSMMLSANTSTTSADQQIVAAIRAPRVALALLIGTLLAVCGAVLQGLFRNPLADPSLIGVTAGASAGASIAIVAGGGLLGGIAGLPLIALSAAAGGLAAVVIVYRAATGPRGTAVATMLLAGIAVSAMAAALNSLLSYFADNDMLRRISLWHMGNLDGAGWTRVGVASAVVAPLVILLPRFATGLNALLLGESEARHLGINVERLKRSVVTLAALGVGCAVALAGAIAFVGLVVPHMVRLLIGPDHQHVIPASALAGAILLCLADTLARVVVAPAELPTGIVTALVGAPVFFAILLRHRPRF